MIVIIEQTAAITAQLGRLMSQVQVQTVPDVAAARQVLVEPSQQVDAVVLGPELGTEGAVRAARTLRQVSPSINLVMIADDATPDLLRSAMRAGISDVLDRHPSDADLKEAVDRARELTNELRAATTSAPQAPDSRTRSKVFTVFSTKGGSGKSLLATNLAVLLAQEHPDGVVLVDLDVQSGDAAVMLQLLPRWTIADAAEQGSALDVEQLRGFLTVHPDTRLRMLAAPLHPNQSEQVGAEHVGHILSLLRSMFRYVIIDAPAHFTDPLLMAVDHTDTVVVVAMMDVPSIKNLRTSTEALQELGIPRDRLRLVLNRADSKVGLTVKEIESSLGTSVDAQIPSSREVPFTVNKGQPIVVERPRSGVSESIRLLLDQLREPPGRSGRRQESRGRFRIFGG